MHYPVVPRIPHIVDYKHQQKYFRRCHKPRIIPPQFFNGVENLSAGPISVSQVLKINFIITCKIKSQFEISYVLIVVLEIIDGK